MESEAVLVKGAGIGAGLQWFTRKYGEVARRQLIEMLPKEERDMLRTILPSSWYPVSLLSNINECIARYSDVTTRPAQEKLFKELNRWVAEENLSTLYRALLILMTPDRLFEILPRLWSTYFKGVEVEVHRTPNAPRGTCTVH